MNFDKWMEQNTEWIAISFAKSNDPKAIRDVLQRVNLLWGTQLQQALGTQDGIRLLSRMVNDLIEEK